MASGTIHRTIKLLQESLIKLDVDMPLLELERIGVMVNNAMSLQGRSFHTPEHIFDLVDKKNPFISLAALFHDLVYYHVDQGFTKEVEAVLSSSIQIRKSTVSVTANAASDDRPLKRTLLVFGYKAGQELSPFNGMNEFLSALVLNRELDGIVPEKSLIIVTCCIEATIPFRSNDKKGRSPADLLEERLRKANRDLELGMDEKDILLTVEWSVIFANKDVQNFAEEDVGRFLDNTWKLLPETNPSLRTSGIYSISSYRTALQKMEGFLGFLDPDTIFGSYRSTPPKKTLAQLRLLAHRNVETAKEYIGIKFLTAAILESLAEVSGGDAPVALFMGSIDGDDPASKLEYYLPKVEVDRSLPIDQTIHDLLAFGRAGASSFDLQNSPLSLFIYLHLGTDGFHEFLNMARQLYANGLPFKQFLENLPRDMICPIAKACTQIVFTRSEALESCAASIGRSLD